MLCYGRTDLPDAVQVNRPSTNIREQNIKYEFMIMIRYFMDLVMRNY